MTFGDDGSYGLYESDERGRWTNIVTACCGHWQTGGLKDAQTDRDGRNVLALTRRGNLLCTGFRWVGFGGFFDNTRFVIIAVDSARVCKRRECVQQQQQQQWITQERRGKSRALHSRITVCRDEERGECLAKR